MSPKQVIGLEVIDRLNKAAESFAARHNIVIGYSHLPNRYYALSLSLANRNQSEDKKERRVTVVKYELWRRLVSRITGKPELRYEKDFLIYLALTKFD